MLARAGADPVLDCRRRSRREPLAQFWMAIEGMARLQCLPRATRSRKTQIPKQAFPDNTKGQYRLRRTLASQARQLARASLAEAAGQHRRHRFSRERRSSWRNDA